MSLALTRDGGAFSRTLPGGAATATAGGTGDNTAVTGPRADISAYRSAKLVIVGKATLAQDATLTLKDVDLKTNTASSGGTSTAHGTGLATKVVATGPAGGGTVHFTLELDYNLEAAKQYAEAVWTPDLSAANTDTAVVAATLVLFGGEQATLISAKAN